MTVWQRIWYNQSMEKNATEKQAVRLQKYLAEQGLAGRRAAEGMIADGRVTVNGETVTAMGTKVVPGRDRVCVDGVLLHGQPRLRYILLHKPTGYLCTVRDDRGRRTVLELISGVQERIYPVGRLDYDTSGLLLLTNDGALTQRLLHPSGQVNKTYLAEVRGCPDRSALMRLRQGVRLADGMTAPAAVCLLRRDAAGSLVELTIHEGRNRQVRRMLEAVGHPVLRLKRTRFAGLDLTGLAVGCWRELRREEVAELQAICTGNIRGRNER